jgi:uncharacterized membrane protein HdeD (DUF308 family)
LPWNLRENSVISQISLSIRKGRFGSLWESIMNINELEINHQPINSRWITGIAVFMCILGIFAIIFPFFATIASTFFFGWLFVFSGISQIVYAFHSRRSNHFFWQFVLGILYFLSGVFIVSNILEGVLTLTLILGITIFVQGIIQVSIAFKIRRRFSKWVSVLMSGIIGIIFGIFIWSNFPLNALWMIGLLVGVNLLADGIWMLSLYSGQKTKLNSIQ